MLRILLLLVGTLGIVGFAYTQQASVMDMWQHPTTRNFTSIQQNVEQYYKDRDKGKGSGYKQWKRWEYWMQDRLTGGGLITNYTARNVRAHLALQQQGQNRAFTNGGYWNMLAPTDGYVVGGIAGRNPGLGRVNIIAFHPTNGNTIFAGTPSGGLWKTTNAGISWSPLTDGLPRVGISGIAIHPTNPNIIYVLTGDGDGSDTYSVGVLKSIDGGVNWHTTGLSWSANEMENGYKLVMQPTNPDILLAATTQGIYRTEDGGSNWSLVLSGLVWDIECKPDDPTIMYATAASSDRFYRSTNSGVTWTITYQVTGAGRVEIAVTPANSNVVYLLAGPSKQVIYPDPPNEPDTVAGFVGIYKSTNSGLSFAMQVDTPNILSGALSGHSGKDQSAYDIAIAVDPNDPNEIITGGINMWRDENGSGSNIEIIAHWNFNTAQNNGLQYVHADIHELVFQDDSTIWCGSDGGIFRSNDDGITWEDRSSAGTDNGLGNMQFYRIAGYPASANIMVGGTQDNGSNRWEGGNDVIHFSGADGGDCMIDPGDSDVQYSEEQRGVLYKSLDGGANLFGINPSNSGGAFITPLAMDPINSNEIWAAYVDTIYRSLNGGSNWVAFIPALNGESYQFLHIPAQNPSRIYACARNYMYRSDNNGISWTEITGSIPLDSTNFRGITTDVTNSSEVWVVLSQYSDGNKVFYSSNAGATWTNVTGGLPNIAVNCIVYDDNETFDNAVYVGTDIGVFYKDASLSDWVPFRNGLPTVPITDLEVHLGAQKLRAATFGRGIWESDLYAACPFSRTLTNGNLPGTGPQGYRSYQASGFITSSRLIEGGAGTSVFYQANNEIKLLDGFQAKAGITIFKASLGICTGGIPEND